MEAEKNSLLSSKQQTQTQTQQQKKYNSSNSKATVAYPGLYSSSSSSPPPSDDPTKPSDKSQATYPTVVQIHQQPPAYYISTYVIQNGEQRGNNILTLMQFGDLPASVICPNCGHNVVTKVYYEAGTITWLTCIGLFVFTACCCWIPFFVDSLQDAVHRCPSCKAVLGKWRRL